MYCDCLKIGKNEAYHSTQKKTQTEKTNNEKFLRRKN
jgi:hypothetical protein